MTGQRAFVIGLASSLLAGAILWLIVNDRVNSQVDDLKKLISQKYGVTL